MFIFFQKHIYKILLVLILLVHGLGLFCDVFNGDSALYASIAKNIAVSGDWLILDSIMQENWIDKPHFAFWIWAIFIKIFGNTNFGFKLPSFIALLILLHYLYLFTKKYYDEKTAWTCVLIFSSSLHIFISTNDTRIDVVLIAFMMAAIYHFQLYVSSTQLIQLIIGVGFTSMAVMTKGIYILIPIGISILVLIISEKNYKRLLHPHWFLALVLFFIGISPALYALKVQFSRFDGALILGQKATNYLQFFFWDSQFGRFNSNLGQVQSNGDPSFYLHTLLWAFAPWTILLFLFLSRKKNPLKEYISLACLMVTLVILSISKTQLSHHVLILLPFLSILTAVIFRTTLWRLNSKFFLWFIYLFFGVILIASIYLTSELFGVWVHSKLILLFVSTAILLLMSYFMVVQRVLIVFVTIAVFLGLYLNTIFYPEILQYQSGRQASVLVNKLLERETVEEFYVNISLLNFYSSVPVKNTKVKDMDALLNKKNQHLYTNDYGLNYLGSHGVKFKMLEQYLDYRTTVLKMNFIDKSRRENECEKHYLIRINPD